MKKIDWVGYFLLGAFVALVAHYYLYRISLPLSPFVYQAF